MKTKYDNLIAELEKTANAYAALDAAAAEYEAAIAGNSSVTHYRGDVSVARLGAPQSLCLSGALAVDAIIDHGTHIDLELGCSSFYHSYATALLFGHTVTMYLNERETNRVQESICSE